MTADPPAIEIEKIVKSFGATKALNEASFRVRAGSVHALLGENGAGKSTMIKLLSGTIQPDSGTIRVYGEEIVMREPRDAHRHGLQTAFQELTLVPDLTVLQNMALPYEPVGFGWQLRRREARRIIEEFFDRIGLGDIDPRKEARAYNLNTRQKIEIARAIFRKPRILFLDEATSTLSGDDIDWLDGLIATLKADGVTIVFITHRMAEVRRLCDEVTVLRNGRDVGTFHSQDIEDQKLIELIVGRSLSTTFPPPPDSPPSGAPVLTVSGLGTAERLHECSFDLRPGEILGVAALQGMGQRELFLALFGAEPVAGGTITLSGEQIAWLAAARDQAWHRPRAGRAQDRGSVLEAQRTRERPYAGARPLRTRRCARSHGCDRCGRRCMQRVQVDLRALYTPAGAFSGGNQQKIVLAKWLVTQTRCCCCLIRRAASTSAPTRDLSAHARLRRWQAAQCFSTRPRFRSLPISATASWSCTAAGWCELARGDGAIDERDIVEAALGHTRVPAVTAPVPPPALQAQWSPA